MNAIRCMKPAVSHP